MDFVKRSTKKYSFKKVDLTELRKLGSFVSDPEKFRGRYGKLLGILKTNVEDGILETLVQFYDPLYHCFTFPDYQLVPTLEEYAFWIGLPIASRVPFSGLEKTPDSSVVAQALYLTTADVADNLISRDGSLGLTSKFLFNKAHTFAQAGSMDAFDAILALLIYGLVLFPHIDRFVDMSAIQLFLSRNPVPTLLADTYHSIHHRTLKGGGTIYCCAPLLYRWFISHLPRTDFFRKNPNGLLWSQRIMSLTSTDIEWYDTAYDTRVIIDGCGEFPNVPLLGTRGGINYNPILARRQFGYPMRDKPNSLLLSASFFFYQEEGLELRNRFVQAWRTIHRKRKDMLGVKLSFASDSYTRWVIERATGLGMPYSKLLPASSTSMPFGSTEETQEQVAEAIRQESIWKWKYQQAETEVETLKGKLEQKDHQLLVQSQQIVELRALLRQKDALLRRDTKRRRYNMGFFSGSRSDSDGSTDN